MSTIQYDRVRELAKSKGLSLNDVEEKIGLKKNALYAWNRNTPSGDNLSKVADYFNVSVDYLLGRTDDRHLTKKEQDEKDLQEFLKDNMEHGMTYADHELTTEDKERLKIALTQIFWKYHDKY